MKTYKIVPNVPLLVISVIMIIWSVAFLAIRPSYLPIMEAKIGGVGMIGFAVFFAVFSLCFGKIEEIKKEKPERENDGE